MKEPQKGTRTFKLLCNIITLMKQNRSFLEIRINRARIDLAQRANATTQLKGQCHENHFKNTRVQKHIYSNGKLQVVVHFLKNSNVSVKKLKKDVISLR